MADDRLTAKEVYFIT